MQTKLHRIDELMRKAKDRKYTDGDYANLDNELNDRLRAFHDETSMMKDPVV